MIKDSEVMFIFFVLVSAVVVGGFLFAGYRVNIQKPDGNKEVCKYGQVIKEGTVSAVFKDPNTFWPQAELRAIVKYDDGSEEILYTDELKVGDVYAESSYFKKCE